MRRILEEAGLNHKDFFRAMVGACIMAPIAAASGALIYVTLYFIYKIAGGI